MTSFRFGLVILILHPFFIHAAIIVTNIAQGCDAGHNIFIKSDGSLWAMGSNFYGQMGDGTQGNAFKPEEIVVSNVVATAKGGEFSLFLQSNGSLWAMGSDVNGALGDGGFYDAKVRLPEEIVSNNVIAIAAGGSHSLFLKSDGSLWGMGYNGFGQLGDGTISDNAPYWGTNQPEEIVSSNVLAIAAGFEHSLFLKSDGSLWAMGNNQYGQLGDGIFSGTFPYSVDNPEEIVDSNVVAIAAGGYHSLFLKSDGSLWAMGDDQSGQLGDGISNLFETNQPEEIVSSNVLAIAAGYEHSLFLKSDGSLWSMGNNQSGQLGDGTYNEFTNQAEEIVNSNVVLIAAGHDDSLFVKSDGSLWAMGSDSTGELGDGFVGNLTGSLVPEKIFPPPQPFLLQSVSMGTNLQFTATCGFGGNFYLLESTNLSQPLCQWVPVASNDIIAPYENIFSATLTNGVSAGCQQFFILQSY